jgi:hypothetical protein
LEEDSSRAAAVWSCEKTGNGIYRGVLLSNSVDICWITYIVV